MPSTTFHWRRRSLGRYRTVIPVNVYPKLRQSLGLFYPLPASPFGLELAVIGGRKEEWRKPSFSLFHSISSLLSRCRLVYIFQIWLATFLLWQCLALWCRRLRLNRPPAIIIIQYIYLSLPRRYDSIGRAEPGSHLVFIF